MRNGWVRMEKDNGKYDVRSSTVHVDAIYHSQHRLMVSGIQVQIQWHSPATMATMLCANRLTSDARFNLFVGEIPVHTHTHTVCPNAQSAHGHIYSPKRGRPWQWASAAATERKRRMLAATRSCRFTKIALYSFELQINVTESFFYKCEVECMRHFFQCHTHTIQTELIRITCCRCRCNSNRVRFSN